MTSFYEISLGLSIVLLLMALGWSVSMRRRLKEQTEVIRKQFEREAALEAKYHDLFENANDLVFRQDIHGRITSLNKAGERILACPREHAGKMALKEYVAPAQAQDYERWLHQCLTLGDAPPPFEVQLVACDGRHSIVELSARILQENGKPVGIEGIGRDITERKRSEDALRQSEERFSSAFRLSPLAIAISDRNDGSFLDVNDSFLRFLGFSREEVIRRRASKLKIWADPQDQQRLEMSLREHQSVGPMECRLLTKAGEIRNTLLFVERIEVGKLACALSVIHDMTERILLENQLRQAQKMDAVGRLAAGVAHDFNNLLSVIQGNTGLVMEDRSISASAVRRLDQVTMAVRRASTLTRQLLVFSRKHDPQPMPLELNALINGSVKMFLPILHSTRSGQDIPLKLRFSPNLPVIMADSTMIEQVLMNLVINSRDAMPEGGELSIRTSMVQIDKSSVARHPEASLGDYVRLSVADTGCGMDAATISRIFDPFFTTKAPEKGTGLGLSTVYGIIKAHRGWIEVASQVGQGTTFHVFIPCDNSQKPTWLSGEQEDDQELADQPPTILSVEDDPTVAAIVTAVLKSRGYEVFEAPDALEALQIWNEHADGIDLVFTDIKLPNGMSGLELAENLRALKPDVKVLFTSGYSPDTVESNNILREGGNFLPKPYPMSHLVEMVACRLQRDQSPAAALAAP